MHEGIALWFFRCDPLTVSSCEENMTRVDNFLSTIMFKVFHINEVADYRIYGRKPVRDQLEVSNFFQLSVNSFGYF